MMTNSVLFCSLQYCFLYPIKRSQFPCLFLVLKVDCKFIQKPRISLKILNLVLIFFNASFLRGVLRFFPVSVPCTLSLRSLYAAVKKFGSCMDQ